MDQLKLVEDSLQKILLGVFLNTLSQMSCYFIFKIKIKTPLLIDNSLIAADELQG